MSRYVFRVRNIFDLILQGSKKNNYIKVLSPLQNYIRRPIKIVTVLALFWPLKNNSQPDLEENNRITLNKYLQEADNLYDNEQYHDCLQHINKVYESYPRDVELLWRKSRVLYQLASQPNITPKRKHELANEAFSTINLALEIDDNHFAVHKWMSVVLDLHASCESLSLRIKTLEKVKSHMLRATEINPHDATTLYMLGEWCYRIADMPWYQRQVAKTLFATPPTSTFEEAIQYFSKAEIAEPRFYSMNLLMLGKTYLKLGKQDIAKYYLNLALLYPAKSNDDHQANKEAQEVLKNIK